MVPAAKGELCETVGVDWGDAAGHASCKNAPMGANGGRVSSSSFSASTMSGRFSGLRNVSHPPRLLRTRSHVSLSFSSNRVPSTLRIPSFQDFCAHCPSTLKYTREMVSALPSTTSILLSRISKRSSSPKNSTVTNDSPADR